MNRGRILPLLGIAAGVTTWQIIAMRAGPLLLPAPGAVLNAMATESPRLLGATLQTAAAASGGLLIALALGAILAVAAWWSEALRLTLTPWTLLLQIVPIVAIAPILVVWVGYGTPVALITSTIAAFYPIYSAIGTGLSAPSADLVDLVRLYGATRWRELVDLRVTAALPAMFSGLRSAAGLAVIGAIVGEFVGSNGVPPTLGYLVVYSARSARTDLCFAAIGCSGGLAFMLHLVVRWAERRLISRWYGV